jgi:hypothetical protein
MKMVECMEDKSVWHFQGETESKVTHKPNVGPSNGNMG